MEDLRLLSEAPEEDLRAMSDDGGPLAPRWCAKCDHHYRFCRCEEPVWKIRWDGKLVPMLGEPGAPHTLLDEMERREQR